MQTTVYDEREVGLEQQPQERLSRQALRLEESRDGMATALGWFSLGLGVAELAAPRRLSRWIGVQERPNLLRLLGLREIASGLGILMQGRPTPWLWSRLAGDAVDLTLLGIALNSAASDRKRVGVATAAAVGVTALDIISSTRQIRESEPIRVRKAITINRPPEELYRFWRDLQNLPRFMKNLESVRTLGGDRSHWIASGPGGSRIEWDAEITQDQPNEKIAWRSLEGADVDNWGSVRFWPTPRGTEVHVEIRYSPPGGRLGFLASWLTGKEPGQQVQEDLRRLKRVMETGEIPTTAGQPSGPSKTAILSSLFRAAERRRGLES
ncbi:MAG: SRPBCC family protein [Acidobacteriota bacterium]